MFSASNLRYYHEIAHRYVDKILEIIEAEKKHEERFYEPVDTSIWEEIDFGYQRSISYAIMGYRLTSQDVEACPDFPQVDKTEKQLKIVDYAMIQGETGCGKSISLFQVAYRFAKRGWKVYLLRNSFENSVVSLPDNSENSVYLVDDAQIYSNSLIDYLERQARPHRKVLMAKTVAESLSTETILLTNKDSVNILYKDFLKRKNDIWPIVRKCDSSIGVNMHEIPIERRLSVAKEATTPWQFSYILRGGWKTMKDLYSSICKHNNCDLLAATIAAFQVLKLDKNVDFDYLCSLLKKYNAEYNWTKDDLQYLINKKIVLSEDDIRIVHLESAHVIVYLFFDCRKTEKQKALLSIIEDEFVNGNVSPLGIVWLCNRYRGFLEHYFSAEELFLTDKIVNNVGLCIEKMHTSEEIRNTLYLVEKIIQSDRNSNTNAGIQILKTYESRLIELIYHVDSVSAWGYGELFNTLINRDKKVYRAFSKKIDWYFLMERFLAEKQPNYYSWGNFFNRGLSHTGKEYCLKYSEKMYDLIRQLFLRAKICDIDGVTSFSCKTIFLNYDRIHELMPLVMPVYRQYFETNMEKAIHIFDFEFIGYICGVNTWGKQKPSTGQKSTAKLLLESIPNDKLAKIISNSSMHDWYSIRDVLYFIFVYDQEKYNDVIRRINLEELSICVKDNWGKSHDICLVIDALRDADINIAKTFIRMNINQIECFYSLMISVDANLAININKEKGIPLDLLTEHWWDYSLEALNKLIKADRRFAIQYLFEHYQQIADRYSNVRGLDFTGRASLDLLKLIKETSNEVFSKIVQLIDKDKILKEWDNCGYDSRKKRWVAKRKDEFFELIS